MHQFEPMDVLGDPRGGADTKRGEAFLGHAACLVA
jgi:hypothetical protein